MRSMWVGVLLFAACGDDSGPAQTPDASADASIDASDYLDRSLRDQVSAIESGATTGSALAAGYLARIADRDRRIHAVIVTDPQASTLAAALDGQKGQGALLQGAVILVKDNIDTQAIATTAGSLAMAANVPTADAFLIKRIHDAHGLMLGKTNLSEWANFRGYSSTSGWSSLGGQTYNGRNPMYDPCGSSSGSAAAVAAGMASGAIGTETDGSITCPSSINGVVGFKPTVGLVSRAGIIPISASQDTGGPITKTVGDAARILRVIAGPDPNDPATQNIPTGFNFDFEAPLATATLSGKRFGVVSFGFGSDVLAVFEAEKTRMQNAGVTFVDVTFDMSWGQDELQVLLYEFKDGINAYLAAHMIAGQAQTLQDLINYNQAHAATVMPYFGQQLFTQAQATTGLTTPAYLTAKMNARTKAGMNGITATLTANNLDALVSPTTGPAWMINYSTGDPPIAAASSPAAVAGYPHLTVPMGTVNNLPVGISFFAGQWDDAKVLAIGYAYEQLPR
jgi:amidase